jgi:membrane fusion protein (multidrug efflux system)
LLLVLWLGIPQILLAISTVSTDDAYVNGHVTFVAPRVPGQVLAVYVDDNNRVRRGDLLMRLDPVPYQVQVDIAQAAVRTAEANEVAAEFEVRAQEAQARSNRFRLDHAVQEVDNQISLLRSKAAALDSQQATLNKAEADFQRVQSLVATGAVAKEEIDRRQESLLVARAQLEAALEDVYQVRVSLGLPAKPQNGDLRDVPPDLDQTFSSVRQAQADVMQSAAQFGVTAPMNETPREMIANFYKRDPNGDINKIYAALVDQAPAVLLARQKLNEARQDLAQAKLNLSYCDVVSEIDGVITRRDVNPGNNVVVGQAVMAVRSLTDIWVDANFKETQLAAVRIGQPVDLYVDMYGGRRKFEGRVSGFTMGTGSTLALLPAQNATGNFVKVVQRVPVRIDFVNYDPDAGSPLLVGVSVTPYVKINEQPTGPNAGQFFQPFMTLPRPPINSAVNPATNAADAQPIAPLPGGSAPPLPTKAGVAP